MYSYGPQTMSLKHDPLITKSKGKVIIKSKTDSISELPDEILSSIVSYFTVRDAANASVLSSTWRHLCASMPNLDFSLISTFRPDKDAHFLHKRDTRTCRQYKDRFVRVVNQFLQYYKGSRAVRFEVTFCLHKDSTVDIDQWVIFAVNMGVKDLCLLFSCDDCFAYGETGQSRILYMLRCELLYQSNVSRVQTLCLRSCILGPGVINQFSSLKFLSLTDVTLGAHEIESIFSCCLNLEKMRLGNCTLIPILCIPGTLNWLKYLAVTNCWGVEKIELSATNLTYFDYYGDCVKFSFSRVPNLKEVFFRTRNGNEMWYVFSQLAKDLPLVETLLVLSTANWVQCLPGQITTFNKLKQLRFYSPKKIEFDILKIIAIVNACPLLEKLYLVIVSVHSEQAIPEHPMPCECVHKYLKEVHIGGFHFRASYIELALRMLEYGVALEQMVIDPKLEFYYGIGNWCMFKRMTWDEGERAKVCSQLHNHSKSSLIIIR